VGFDYNMLKGVKTHAVNGSYDATTALTKMLKGTSLGFEFVNDHTLAITRRPPSRAARIWNRMRSRPRSEASAAALEQGLISGSDGSGTQRLLGAQVIQFGRPDIERTGLATPEDFLRTLPQIFGGGPSQDTVLGREASTNSAYGSGVNLRGLNASATLVL